MIIMSTILFMKNMITFSFTINMNVGKTQIHHVNFAIKKV